MSLSDETEPKAGEDTERSSPETERPEPARGGPAAGDGRSLAADLDEVERSRPERAFNVGAVLGVLVTVAAVIFVVQNRRTATFDWLWFDFDLPLWVVLVGGIAAGVVLTVTALAVHARRQRRIGRRREAAGRLRRALRRDRQPRPA